MLKNLSFAAGIALLAGSATASFVVYDITADPAGWANALAANGLVAAGGWDFDRDAPYDIIGFDGPLTSAGAGPVSPGTIDFPGVSINATNPDINSPGLVTVGPGAGYGNPHNAVLANFFVEAFVMEFDNVAAVEFNALSLLGSNSINIGVNGDQFLNLFAPPQGRKYGLIATGGAISSFTILMEDPATGAEGIQGWGQVYIPAPGSLALLGLAGLAIRRRR